MTDIAAILSAPPFDLTPAQIGWVTRTLAALDTPARIAQLFVLLSRGMDPEEPARLARLRPGGITRMFGPDGAAELDFLERVRAEAAVPLFVSADLEGSRMSLAFGTEVPNPLALAAVDDVQATAAISRIMAQEARAVGVNWSFTPLLDINAAFRSAIVATRGFGADPDRIARHALTQIREFEAEGIAATAKHWPGEGHDDRDQHLLTTINPLSVPEWEATHGALYRQAIAQGVKTVMAGHIALPAFAAEAGAEGLELYRPASVSRPLLQGLLRGRLGFNGLIVSDATPMAGFGSWAPRAQMVPEVIANGCDVLLFSDDPEGDMAHLLAALADGRLSAERLEEALVRVLGLKAALGLDGPRGPAERARVGRAEDRAVAQAVTARAPTLVKDVQGLLPLSPARHRRVLCYDGGVVLPFFREPLPLDLPQMLRDEGFEVTLHDPANPRDPRGFDLVMYLLGEETLLTRGRIHLDWARLMGGFQGAMVRPWHEVPTILVSFGWPYYLYDAPRLPCLVNAYASAPGMQAAVRDCLLGRAPFAGTSPLDPFCGLPDARY